MSCKHPRPAAHTHLKLDACQKHCWICGAPLWVAYAKRRKVITLAGLVQLYVPVRRCQNRACPRSHRPYRLEAEGHYALPHGEFGLDVIALVGQVRFAEHRSVPEIRAELDRRGVSICERSVTEQLYRYEELLALRLADQERLRSGRMGQGHVVLALDGRHLSFFARQCTSALRQWCTSQWLNLLPIHYPLGAPYGVAGRTDGRQEKRHHGYSRTAPAYPGHAE